MKDLIPIIIFFTVIGVSCSNKQDNHAEQTSITSTSENKEEDDKDFCKQTFKAFINLDEAKVKEREGLYLLMLEQMGEVKESDSIWYRRNIAHIDSIARYCIELSENDKDAELLDMLDSEMANFQSHPNADTYLCFDLNLVLTKLYFAQSADHPDYLQKCIDLWELNRVQIEAVQRGWQEYHPLYFEALNILLKLYEKVDNPLKITEMQALINDVTKQSE